MTHRHQKHAHEIVERFKGMLSESGRQHIGAKHFDELALLIESGISSAVLDELEIAANKMDNLAHEVRNYAESFDDTEQTIKSA